MKEKELRVLVKKMYPNFLLHKEDGIRATSLFLMEKQGNGMIRVCWYHSEMCAVISDLSVSESFRKNGLGAQLMGMAEALARAEKKDFVQLRVLKDSWTEEWYKRRGYRFFEADDDKRFVMLIKDLR